MLENGQGRSVLGEFREQTCRGGQVQNVVVGKFLAAQLLEEIGESSVERGALMRVLAVTQRLRLWCLQEQHGRQPSRCFLRRRKGSRGFGRRGFRSAKNLDEMRGDDRVVGRGAREHARCQLAPKLQRGVPFGFDLSGDFLVVVRVHHHGDVGVVLGGAAEQGGPADIDVLDGFLQGDVGPRRDLLEGIEVHHDQINRTDAVLSDCCFMPRIAPEEKQAAMHFRVQRLQAAVEHFREPGIIAQLDDRQAGLAQEPGGAAGGNQLHARCRECLREGNESCLVENGDERPPDSRHKSRLNSSRNFGRVNDNSAPLGSIRKSPISIR